MTATGMDTKSRKISESPTVAGPRCITGAVAVFEIFALDAFQHLRQFDPRLEDLRVSSGWGRFERSK
jgi:hypothetical protein